MISQNNCERIRTVPARMSELRVTSAAEPQTGSAEIDPSLSTTEKVVTLFQEETRLPTRER
jgi:hypothetical protein